MKHRTLRPTIIYIGVILSQVRQKIVTFLERMNLPKKSETILESVLNSLHKDGILDSYIQQVIEEQKSTLGKVDQDQLLKSPVIFLLEDFKGFQRKVFLQQTKSVDIGIYLLEEFTQQLDTPSMDINREWIAQHETILDAIIEREAIFISEAERNDIWAMIVKKLSETK